MWAGRGPGVASPVVLTCTTPAAGKLLAPYKYAALQKLDDPNEICAHEAVPSPPVLQAEHVREVVGLPGARAPFRRRGKALGAGRGLPPVTQRPSAQARTCAQLLALVAPACTVPTEPFLRSCQADLATCAQPGQQSCGCATLSEYSRQCSLAGQPVSRWRGPGLCCESRGRWGEGGEGGTPNATSSPRQEAGRRRGWAGPRGACLLTRPRAPAALGPCPANQVYQECGEACVKTCSNPQHSCASVCTFGCFCPEGEAPLPWRRP